MTVVSIVVLVGSLVMLLLVLALTSVQLRRRRCRWPFVFVGVLLYLLVANFLSRVVLGPILFMDPTSLTMGEIEVRRLIQSALSLPTAAMVNLVVFALVRRLLPKVEG